ncbi:MAG: TolC family protein [Methylocella sp.]
MRGREGSIVIVLSSLWLASCATSAIDMAPERPDRPWTPATTADGEIIAGERGASGAANNYVLPANPALAGVPPPSVVDIVKVYSLPELIDLAESNNPTTQIAWNDARRVALAAGIAQSAYLPRITLGVIGGLQGSSGSQSALNTSFNSSGSANGTVSAVSLQWLLFDFGERAAVVDAAKQASLISNIAFTAAHQQVIYSVALAFYKHAAARARLATAAQSLKNAQAVQAAAEDRQKHGIGTVIEVAQARQGTAQANLAVVEATGGAQDAYLALITAMGLSPLTKIKIADVSGRRLSQSMTAPVETIISESLARRPDVQSAYAAQKASLANVRAAEAEFLPKLFLSGNGTYNSGNLDVTALPSAGQQPPAVNITSNRLGGSIFGGVAVPLYDGGTRAATLEQARAEADSADARMARVREEAVRQIVLSDNALHTGLSAYAASQSLTTAAQTTFDAALAAYRSGVGSITDLILSETQLLQAKNAATDAYSTTLSAAATLALSTGTLGAAPQ